MIQTYSSTSEAQKRILKKKLQNSNIAGAML